MWQGSSLYNLLCLLHSHSQPRSHNSLSGSWSQSRPAEPPPLAHPPALPRHRRAWASHQIVTGPHGLSSAMHRRPTPWCPLFLHPGCQSRCQPLTVRESSLLACHPPPRCPRAKKSFLARRHWISLTLQDRLHQFSRASVCWGWCFNTQRRRGSVSRVFPYPSAILSPALEVAVEQVASLSLRS